MFLTPHPPRPLPPPWPRLQLVERDAVALDALCRRHGVRLLLLRSYGLAGYLRPCVPEQAVVESKPDSKVDDLRRVLPHCCHLCELRGNAGLVWMAWKGPRGLASMGRELSSWSAAVPAPVPYLQAGQPLARAGRLRCVCRPA